MTYAHFVAHARGELVPLADAEQAGWLWTRLSDAFPDALVATLMPDHPHFVAPARSGARRKLAAVLGAFSRRFDLGEVWQRVPEPQLLTSEDKLQRVVRYDLLNPCGPWKHAGRRVQLVSDPLAWPWSTLRDVVGAVAEPWVDADRLRMALGWEAHDFQRRFHKYISSDPHVRVTGTPFPEAAPPSLLPRGCIEDVMRAAAVSTRAPMSAIRERSKTRTVFLALAYRQGWRQPTLLGKLCGIRAGSVCRLVSRCPREWLEAAALCLGDARILVTPERCASLTFKGEQGVVRR